MKKNWNNKQLVTGACCLMITFVIILLVNGCVKKNTDLQQVYTCAIHPDVMQHQPGSCPVCGMELTIKIKTDTVTKKLNFTYPTYKNVLTSSNTIRARAETKPVRINANGIVAYDARHIKTISATNSGRLEKVYLKYDLQQIKKGEPIADLYSPQLITVEHELLYEYENDSTNSDRIRSIKTKLLLLGLTAQQLEHIIKTKQVFTSLPIYSAYDGYLIPNDQTPILREGNYINKGETLFTIASSSALSIEISLPTVQGSHISLHDSVTIQMKNGIVEKRAVDYIEPFIDAGVNFIKLLVYIKGKQNFKIGEIIQCTIDTNEQQSLWLPRTSVVDLGLRTIVFVKDGDVFKPKQITVSLYTNNQVQVTGDLLQTDEIARSAQYLVDSDNFIMIK